MVVGKGEGADVTSDGPCGDKGREGEYRLKSTVEMSDVCMFIVVLISH